jgi:uncharacterized RDD family membrane protein YckC
MAEQPQTPQPPTPARPPAKLGRRFVARLIDALLLGAVGVVIGLPMAFSTTWLVIQAVLVFAYFVVLDVTWGTTVGKRLLGLTVQGPGGRRPSFAEAAPREAFTLLGAIPYAGPVLALIAWIAIAVTISRSDAGQGIHDQLGGGTRVVA